MGLLRGLVGLPLAPVQGATWLSRQILAAAEAQYYDEGAIVAALDELEAAVAGGRVTAQEAEAVEDELLARLVEARARKTEQGGSRTWMTT